MDDLDRDIETARDLVQRAAERGDWMTWLAASVVLLGWRIGRGFRRPLSDPPSNHVLPGNPDHEGELEGQKPSRQLDDYPCEGAEYGVCGGPPHTEACPSSGGLAGGLPPNGVLPGKPDDERPS